MCTGWQFLLVFVLSVTTGGGGASPIWSCAHEVCINLRAIQNQQNQLFSHEMVASVDAISASSVLY